MCPTAMPPRGRLWALGACQAALIMLMKGKLHTDELLAPIVARQPACAQSGGISPCLCPRRAALPPKRCDQRCGVNIAPDLNAKRDIVSNAIESGGARLGNDLPKVGGGLFGVETGDRRSAVFVWMPAALWQDGQRGQITGGW